METNGEIKFSLLESRSCQTTSCLLIKKKMEFSWYLFCVNKEAMTQNNSIDLVFQLILVGKISTIACNSFYWGKINVIKISFLSIEVIAHCLLATSTGYWEVLTVLFSCSLSFVVFISPTRVELKKKQQFLA